MRFYFFIILIFVFSTTKSQTPDNFDGLALWLSIDTMIDNPVFEGIWVDKSSTETNMFFNSRPDIVNINNHYGVSFDGNLFCESSDESSHFSNDEMTIFVAASNINKGAIISIAEEKWNNEFLMFNHSVYQHNWSGNFVYKPHPCLENISDNNIAIISGLFSGNTDEINHIVNGTSSQLEIISRGAPFNLSKSKRKVTLGQRQQFVSFEYLEGVLFEVVVYNRVLSNSEVKAVQNYLHCKYKNSIWDCLNSEMISQECINDNNADCEIDLVINSLLDERLEISGEQTIQHVTIFDATGKLVYRASVKNERQITIPINSWPSALYFIRIEHSCGNKEFKFIKQ